MRTIYSISFALLLLVFCSTNTFAQRYGGTVRQPMTSSTYIGLRGGLGIAGETITPPFSDFTLGTKTGFLAGGQLDYWFDPMWALSVQLLYDQKGASLTSPNNGSAQTETDDLQLGYIEIPVTAKVALGSTNFRPYLFAGPSVGFLTSATTHQVQTTYGVTSLDQTTDETNTFNTVDLSLLFGAGVSYQLTGGTQIMADAGYALGLINIEKNANTGTNETIGSRDIRIGAAVMFPLQ